MFPFVMDEDTYTVSFYSGFSGVLGDSFCMCGVFPVHSVIMGNFGASEKLVGAYLFLLMMIGVCFLHKHYVDLLNGEP